MTMSRHRVALQGFSPFERSALASYFRLADHHPAYEQVEDMADAQFIIADADHAGVIDAVLAADRAGDTVFVGAHAPEGALAWMMRPIDPMHVLRELDAVVALREPGGARRPLPVATRPPAPRGAMPAPRGGMPARRAGDAGAATAPAASTEALIVDDSEIAQRFLERQLIALGLQPQRAANSAKALELLARQRFGFVFLDVELGNDSEFDGLALCQHIKQHRRHPGGRAPVVVMLSAHGEAVDRVRGTLAGCDAYLTKPLDEAELKRTLSRHGVALPQPH
jgi:CheY-like chemotaxis protein